MGEREDEGERLCRERDGWKARAEAVETEATRLAVELHDIGDERDRAVVDAEANAAAAHAIEVIEREELRLEAVAYNRETQRYRWAACSAQITGTGASPISAVADYEQRKAEGGERG